MDKASSLELINKTFSFPFDEIKFSNFLNKIFENNEINSIPTWLGNSQIPPNLKTKVNQYKILGSYKDKNHSLIIVVIIKLLDKNVVEKARHIQRDFSKWLLQKYSADACLVSFFSDDFEDWRFSLVKIEFKREITKFGKLKVKEDISPLKRYSYLVGKNEPNHTAQSQLAPLLLDENKNPTIDELTKAFSVEKVSKEFFENYRDLTFELETEIQSLRKKDKVLNLNFKENKIDNLEFAKKTMGQIVFIYFLQKKNFIGHKFINNVFEKNSSKDFLSSLFNSNDTKEYSTYKNFFCDILQPLFYDGFAKKRDKNLFKLLNCFVPFLSSELFEPINCYDWKNVKILLDNDIFKRILNVFNRYNFTVREEEPLETEVAVDPEMLGKVLENLLPDKEKRLTGTFYTPRPVVNYMCNNAIENFLKIHFSNEINDEDIKKIILVLDSEIKQSFPENYFSKNFNKIIYKIDEKLANIYICDPAIGSGAFTVSIMNKIVKIRILLNSFKNKKDNKYIFKKNFIENCMYGVDIEPSAVETAKLRLYLSLIVDEDDLENLHQLPNLDFKIMQGNSLIDEFSNIKLDLNFYSESLEISSDKPKIEIMIDEIKKLKKDLIYIQDYEVKSIKKKEINKLIYNILKIKIKSIKNFDSSAKEVFSELFDAKTKKNFFAWQIFFSEVFNNKGGFDVVIANPPYKSYGLRGVRSLSLEDKELIKKNYPNSAEYKISFYGIFMDLAFKLANNSGTNILIVPDSFLLGMYFSKIRNLILQNAHINFISLFTYKVFDADVGYTVIYMISKQKSILKNLDANLIVDQSELINNSYKSFTYSQSLFETIDRKKFRLFFDKFTFDLIEKIEKNNIPINKYLSGHTGIRSKIGKEDIISKVKKDEFYKKGLISSSEISKFKIFYDGNWISTNPKILWSGGFDQLVIENEKILMNQTGDSVIAAIDRENYYHLNNVHSFSLIKKNINIECFTAYFNSKIFKFYYQNISLEKKRVMAQIDIENIESLRVKEFNNLFQKEVQNIVNKIQTLHEKKNNQETIIKLIDLLDNKFYDIYNLTKSEKNFIENFISN